MSDLARTTPCDVQILPSRFKKEATSLEGRVADLSERSKTRKNRPLVSMSIVKIEETLWPDPCLMRLGFSNE